MCLLTLAEALDTPKSFAQPGIPLFGPPVFLSAPAASVASHPRDFSAPFWECKLEAQCQSSTEKSY